jgi:nanoRNase/pAp phosphatase (c-di-AMP/oligoRNAs hydrolase)
MKPLELSYYLEEHKEELNPLLVLTHDYPDPDALSSAYALQYLAETIGIRARIVYGGDIGRTENREMVRLLKIPARKIRSSDFKVYPHVALVDTQPGFGNNSFPKKRKAAIVVDQHLGTTEPASDFISISSDAGATSALMARELLAKGIDIPVKLATALVYGILSDTLDFYRVTNRDTIDTYFELLPLCDVRVLARIQNPSRPRRFFREMVVGIRNAQICQRVIVSHLGIVENPDLVSQMADFLMTYEGSLWVLCTGRHGDNLHLSLRTAQTEIGASDVLRSVVENPRFAGGYGQVAGGKIRIPSHKNYEEWEEMEKNITAKLIKRLRLKRNAQIKPLLRPLHIEGATEKEPEHD